MVSETARTEEGQDKRFPLFYHDNPIRRLFGSPIGFVEPYVKEGQVAADLGCGPGFCTLALAELAGPEGKVYAVDFDEKAIRKLVKKADERGYHNIDARVSSACNLGFIGDKSVDFVLANGLLCSMAPQHHGSAVNEIRRILKPTGLAYLGVAKGSGSFVEEVEWERILEGFRVERRGNGLPGIGHRWAVARVLVR